MMVAAMEQRWLSRALHPRSVAIVGVSENDQKYASRLARTIVEGGFDGELHFVNPNPGSYLGHEFVPALSSIPGPVDLTIVSVPASKCAGVVEEVGAVGCPTAVVVTNGFAETGNSNLQTQLVDAGRQHGVRIIGPNCLGVFSAPARLNALGDSTIPSGRLAIVTQSGNIGVALAHGAKSMGLGVSYFLSVGNQVDVGFDDFLEFLEDDEHSDAVLVYAEGFKDAAGFLRAAARLADRKPVGILRGGRSEAGARSAASHTASMSPEDALITAALRQIGVADVRSPSDLLHFAGAFADNLSLSRTNISIIADGGGSATLAADAASQLGLNVRRHPDPLAAKLQEMLGPRAAVGNPVDMTGGFDLGPRVVQDTVEACLADPSTDAVALVGAYGGYGDYDNSGLLASYEMAAADDLVRLRDQYAKPVIVQSIYAGREHEGIQKLRRSGIAVVEELSATMTILARKAARRGGSSSAWLSGGKVSGEGQVLREDQARAWLASHSDVSVPSFSVVTTEDSAVDAVLALGGPAVMKILSDGANHKSDSGGVLLNLNGEVEARAAWRKIAALSQELGDAPRALVTRYVPGSLEALVGMFRHDALGPVVLVGTGGVFAESILDRGFLFPPFTRDDVDRTLNELAIGRALLSPRARGSMRESLVELVSAIGEVAVKVDELVELDLNPVSMSSAGAVVLDVRAVISGPSGPTG